MVVCGEDLYDPSYGVKYQGVVTDDNIQLLLFQEKAIEGFYCILPAFVDENKYGKDFNANGDTTDSEVMIYKFYYRKPSQNVEELLIKIEQ